MATVADLATAIDAFMATPKRIVGLDAPPSWKPGFSRHELETKYPLEVEGELRGAQLMIVGFPNERDIKFRLGILFGGMVCRLDYTDETHPNSVTGILNGWVPPIVSGPHYHSWPINRRFFKGVTIPPELHDALPYPGGGRSLDAVLRWFCNDTMIESPPANHRIALPTPDQLEL